MNRQEAIQNCAQTFVDSNLQGKCDLQSFLDKHLQIFLDNFNIWIKLDPGMEHEPDLTRAEVQPVIAVTKRKRTW